MQRALHRQGFRLPVTDYAGAVREATYIEKLNKLVRLQWFRAKRRSLDAILAEGRVLRERYLKEIDGLLGALHEKRGYERRRALPKVRYRAGRLVYLASRQQLAVLAEQLRGHKELEFQATVLMSVATGVYVTEAVRLGTNVAQAVAQPLRADDRNATVQGPIATEVESQGLAILALNGVDVTGAGMGSDTECELLKLAREGSSVELMRSPDAFVSELACLHGIGSPRHAVMLDSALDAAEESVFDAVSQAVHLPSDW